MRDDSTPPTTTPRGSFDCELTRAMNDIPLPNGLTERLRTAIVQQPLASLPLNGSQPSRDNGRWSRRLLLSSAVALVLVAVWSWLGPHETELTEADVLRIAELDSSNLPNAPPGTQFIPPAGWHSLPGVELASHPVIANDEAFSIAVLPLTFRTRRNSPRVTGLLLALPESRWPFRIDATSLSHTDVRYSATGTWAIWREGTTIFVCILHADARALEALQHASTSSRDVT